MPEFDERDKGILHEREAARNGLSGPRIGDFVIMPDGEYRRFTYDWGAHGGIQTTWKGEAGSFYLGRNGGADYSGSLDHAIPHDRIEATEEKRDGRFWFFHHDFSTAHNGVCCSISCRVYRVKAPE